jgi:hypothetical protein
MKGRKDMKYKTVWLTLAGCIAISFAHLLLFYKLMGGNPVNRIGYAVFISVTPAFAALIWAGLKKTTWTKWRTTEVYFLLFLVTMIVQSYGRMIPVYQIVQSLKQ